MYQSEEQLAAELAPSKLYNSTLQFMNNGQLDEYLAQFDPKFKPRGTGTFRLKDKILRVLNLTKVGCPKPIRTLRINPADQLSVFWDRTDESSLYVPMSQGKEGVVVDGLSPDFDEYKAGSVLAVNGNQENVQLNHFSLYHKPEFYPDMVEWVSLSEFRRLKHVHYARRNRLSTEDIRLAMDWYQSGVDLVTVGQEFGMTKAEVSQELSNMDANLVLSIAKSGIKFVNPLDMA